MKNYRLPLILLVFLMGSVTARATSLTAGETDLLFPAPAGKALEMNLGADSRIYLSDYGAKQIWRINPVDDTAIIYPLFHTVQDARLLGLSQIWWTDGSVYFGRINLSNEPVDVTYWEMPEGTNLGGTSIDPVEQIWMTEWFNNAASEIFRFDPGTNEYCTYQVYKNQSEIGGAHSYHLIYDQGFVWIANWDLDRIIRIDPVAEQSTWWQIPNPASRAVGISLDEDGHLWWADEGLGAIMQLDPNLTTNNVRTYPLPFGTSPQMLLLMDEVIWYTEFNDDAGSPSGTFGILHPENANATPSTLTSGSAPVNVVCNQPAGEGTTVSISPSSSSLTWGSLDLSPSLENSAWSIYQLPTTNTRTARPFGIAAGGAYIWMSDQGRQKIIRVEPAPSETRIYLPVVLR